MSFVCRSFVPLGGGGDSNGEDFRQRVAAARAIGHGFNRVYIILTNAHGVAVCVTRIKHNEVDLVRHLPGLTPCTDVYAHYARAMQVYHDRDLYTPVYNAAGYYWTITAPLDPPPVQESAGGE